MTAPHNTEVQRTIHHVASELAALEFINQDAAREISQVAEAVANMFTVLYYQAETGDATKQDFQEAQAKLKEVLLTL
ncbi:MULTISPECIES: type I toxin-antitoxin system ptaRNA1 family toxin [Morganellaceae]|uniref:type I toxin-antitoxin system ptaRNA1 family toxin n=1 Tax=Morganellaceae TaxID=1903414 RepID=UPI000F5BA9E8|nr:MULTISPECIES: type I toxin-antitoxin system ptaRNA1 family toxin [Morganellaceae]EKW4662272.1 type I toxin-antitoxin system ptaRNA1 family toxin [Proteus mirabilis]ELB1686193.1 type I toxin-antitoxin system ptaRNA1 family toxin [Proteus mirabilis]MBS3827694.1 type I toxin-antitoxin system ptaRNA1 family toxin [Proteus mirabilis]MBS3838509.1 type I toxin-antitoxin system ptaRNA1 family toxin [Proteus mirabilis]MDC9789287.1 type I toxin-antitoxin system ptaRNA1 family toxin [Proteus mirabilis